MKWLISRTLLIGLVLFFSLSSCLQLIHHSQYKAVSSANKVLSLLFNERYEEAYLKLHPNAQEKVPFEIFKKLMQQVFFEMSSGIERITFDYYLPVSGQRAIQLYYKVYYNSGMGNILHLVLLGDGRKGYKVFIIDFGDVAKYPPNIKYYGVKKQKIGGEIVIKPDTIIITPDELKEMIKFED